MSFQRAPTLLLKRIFLLLIVLMIGFLPVVPRASATDFVAEEPFVLTGSFAGTFELSSSDISLFHLEDIAPGDTWTGKIIYKNTCKDKMTVSLLEVRNDLEDPVLFDALTLDIKMGDETLYSGAYGFDKPVVTDYVLESGQELVLDVKVELPIKATNEVQNKEMVSTWIFEAKYYGNPPPTTGVDLIFDNIMDGTVLWFILFGLVGAIVVSIRIMNAKMAAKRSRKN